MNPTEVNKIIKIYYFSKFCSFPFWIPKYQNNLNIGSLMVFLNEVFNMKDTISELNDNFNFKKFTCNNDKEIYLTPINHLVKTTRTLNNNETIEIDDFGYKSFHFKEYIKLIDNIKPDYVVSLTEESRKNSNGTKSLKRSINKSIDFFNSLADSKQSIGFKLIIPFLGVINEEMIKYNFEKIINLENNLLDGIVFYNLFNEANFKNRKLVYDLIKKEFFEGKEKILSSNGDPMNIIESYFYGFNSFESSFSFNLSNDGLYSNYSINNIKLTIDSELKDKDLLKPIESYFESNLKASKQDIKDKINFENFNILAQNCKCYTCINHNKSYIHHLFEHNDLTGNILLMIHNTYQYSSLISLIESTDRNPKKLEIIINKLL